MSSSASRLWITSGRPVCAGGRDLGPETRCLHVARRVIIMIVEPGFADRHHLGMGRQPDIFIEPDIGLLGSIVGMRADRAPHFVMGLGQGPRGIELPHPRADGHA